MIGRFASSLTRDLLPGIAAYILLLLAGGLFYSHMMAPPEEALSIGEMTFTPVRDFSRPLPSGNAESRQLPDDWKHTPSPSHSGVYRKILQLNVPPNRLWAIYLPAINMNAAVYLNGSLLGSGGSFDPPLARNLNFPQYFTIPNGLLRPGDNLVEVRLQSGLAGEGLLDRIYLGPQELLLDSFKRRHFVRVTLVLGISIVMVVIGALLGRLWLSRRQDTVYGWMAFMSLSWAVHNLNLLIIDIPVSTPNWNWMVHSTLGWFVIAMIIASHRVIGIKPERLERVLIRGCIALTVLLAVLLHTTDWYPLLKIGWNSLFATLGLYPIVRVFLAYRDKQNPELPLIVMAGLLVMTFGFHDWMMEIGLWSRTGGYILQYSSPVLLFVFSGIVISRFVTSLNEKEKLNQELEQRIARKHRELQENFERLRTLEKENTRVEERERIMRDIHDGVGGNLVSALAVVDTEKPDLEQLNHILRDGLNNLRLITDSLNPVDNDLTTVIGAWRSRVQPLLESCNLHLKWQVDDLPEVEGLGPQSILHILCILQETVTNILKHANATEVTVRTGQNDNSVFVEIVDNGSGYAAQNTTGHGLINMRHRAQAINANVGMETGPQGTTMRLTLPMQLS